MVTWPQHGRHTGNKHLATMQLQGPPEFYELHLIILSIICLLSLLADRYTKTKQNSGDVVDERPGNSSSLATLTRQYLVVYGIVMSSSYIIILTAR